MNSPLQSCWLCESPTDTRTIPIRGGLKNQIHYCAPCDFEFFSTDNRQLLKANRLDETRLERAGLNIPEIKVDFENGLKQAQAYIDEYIGPSEVNKNILEIGCSWGYFLELAKRKGALPYGLEINPLRTKYVNEKLKIPCFEELSQVQETGVKFHQIFLFYVWEYIASPKAYLSSLYELLEPGGEIILITPNLRDVLKDTWRNEAFYHFFYDECSISYYSPKAINQLAKSLGLPPEKIEMTTRQGYSFINQINWYLNAKPRTTGMVGGDRYITDICNSLLSSNSALGDKLADKIRTFDKEYKEEIEKEGFGNRIILKVKK